MTTTHIMSDETGQQILAQLTAISQALDDGALTNQQISTVLNDGTPTGAGFLDGGGLKTFFDGLKTKFAAITHNHSGDALTPASVAATGAVSGSSISDGTGTLAELRESVSPQFGTIKVTSNIVSDLNYILVKNGNIVNLYATFDVTNMPIGTNQIFIIQDGFRPLYNTDITWHDNSNDLPCSGRVYSYGDFNLYSTSRNSSSCTVYITESWILTDSN